MLIRLLGAHEMAKHVCKISRLNSKCLPRKLQTILGGYFILPHPVYIYNTWGVQFTIFPASPCVAEFYVTCRTRSSHRRNHGVKFLVNRFRGYGVLTPQNCHFPLTCCVALQQCPHYRATLWLMCHLFETRCRNKRLHQVNVWWLKSITYIDWLCDITVLFWQNSDEIYLKTIFKTPNLRHLGFVIILLFRYAAIVEIKYVRILPTTDDYKLICRKKIFKMAVVLNLEFFKFVQSLCPFGFGKVWSFVMWLLFKSSAHQTSSKSGDLQLR